MDQIRIYYGLHPFRLVLSVGLFPHKVWAADDIFVGKINNLKTFFWNNKSARSSVRATDLNTNDSRDFSSLTQAFLPYAKKRDFSSKCRSTPSARATRPFRSVTHEEVTDQAEAVGSNSFPIDSLPSLPCSGNAAFGTFIHLSEEGGWHCHHEFYFRCLFRNFNEFWYSCFYTEKI